MAVHIAAGEGEFEINTQLTKIMVVATKLNLNLQKNESTKLIVANKTSRLLVICQ
jgi:hypothetical protein